MLDIFSAILNGNSTSAKLIDWMTREEDKSNLKKTLPAIALILFSSQAASEISWQPVINGQIPPNAIQGGWEANGTPLPVCRAYRGNERHPGKVVSGRCNYGYGGRESSSSRYDVLVGQDQEYSWEDIGKSTPPGWYPFAGGHEPGRILYICRAKHRTHFVVDKGVHPGKMVGDHCHYGYGGSEQRASRAAILYVKPSKTTSSQQDKIHQIVQEVEKRWFDKHGFMRLNPHAGSKGAEIDNENPVLFTAEYLFILDKLGVLRGELKSRYQQRIKQAIAKLQLEPGLFDRYPEDKYKNRDTVCIRHFSRDEQIGLVVLDKVFDWQLGLARDLVNYGKTHKRLGGNWHYENRFWRAEGTPVDWVCHHGEIKKGLAAEKYGIRTPKFRGLLKMAVGESPDFLAIAEIIGGLKLTARKPVGETSGKILAYLRSAILENSRQHEIKNAVGAFYQEMLFQYGERPLHACTNAGVLAFEMLHKIGMH
ncbi:hypothetical protein THIOM_005373, partial [Candidatus Thiomargarita nelsonii]